MRRCATCRASEIQCDEIWQFVYAKRKNVPREKLGQFGYGDVWTWVALCTDRKSPGFQTEALTRARVGVEFVLRQS